MTDQALTTSPMALGDVMQLGPVLAQSGYFDDAKQAAQAIVKVLAGQEMGFGPIASMVGVHIVKGKPTPGANLMASAVKSNPRYDYQIVKLENDGCTLAFYENGKKVGESSFTAADAQKASTQNMGKFPRNMLFARAISNGVKWFCPDVFNGVTAYTPEELGAEVDGEGEIIDVTPTVIKQQKATTDSENGNGFERPMDAESLRVFLQWKASWHKIGNDYVRVLDGEPIAEDDVWKVANRMEALLPNLKGEARTKARHEVLNYFYTITSCKSLTSAEADALEAWSAEQEHATAETARILEAIAIEQGQLAMEMEA